MNFFLDEKKEVLRDSIIKNVFLPPPPPGKIQIAASEWEYIANGLPVFWKLVFSLANEVIA